MNLMKEQWNQKDYQEYVKYLLSLQDKKYQVFHQGLTTTKYTIIGIRVPLQRKIAKEICQGNYKSFLTCVQDKYYEEVNIEGFIIAYIRETNEYMDSFVSKVDNWAICDGFCCSLKKVNQDLDYYLNIIKRYIKSHEEFRVRVGLILLLDYYVNQDNLDMIFECIQEIKYHTYYIDMAISWLLCECYICDVNQTFAYLKNHELNSFIKNKTSNKINDSNQVSLKNKKKVLHIKES